MAEYRMGVRIPNEPIEYFTELEQLEAWARNAHLFIEAERQLKQLGRIAMWSSAIGITLMGADWDITGFILLAIGVLCFLGRSQVNTELVEIIYNGSDKAMICAFDRHWRDEAVFAWYDKYWWVKTYKQMLLRADRYYPPKK